jgi:hypothetical protein
MLFEQGAHGRAGHSVRMRHRSQWRCHKHRYQTGIPARGDVSGYRQSSVIGSGLFKKDNDILR